MITYIVFNAIGNRLVAFVAGIGGNLESFFSLPEIHSNGRIDVLSPCRYTEPDR